MRFDTTCDQGLVLIGLAYSNHTFLPNTYTTAFGESTLGDRAPGFEVRPSLGRLPFTALPRLGESPLRRLDPRTQAPVELGLWLKTKSVLQPEQPPGDRSHRVGQAATSRHLYWRFHPGPRAIVVLGLNAGTSNLGPSVRLPSESTHTIWSIVGSPVGVICSSSRSNRRESVLVIDCSHRFAARVAARQSDQSRALQ